MEDIRVGFIGDSFVNGTGDPTCLGWTGRVCAQAMDPQVELTYYNLGVRGETSQQIEQRWWAEVEPRLSVGQARLVFSFGVNDTSEQAGRLRLDLADSLGCLERILRTAQSQYPVLMVGPPPIADDAQNIRISDLSEGFDAVCSDLGVPYLEIFSTLSESPIWRAEVAAQDGAHPSAAGYGLLADIVSNWSAWQMFW